MQVHTRRCEPVIAGMSLKRETEEPIEQRDAENVRRSHSRSAVLRKRIFGFFLLVLSALTLGMYVYYRSTYLGSTDWRWFWVGEVIVGCLLVSVIVQLLRKKPKL